MGICKKILTVLFVMICSSFAFARQICFQVVQHDESSDVVTEQSLVIEDQVLNSFFEKGFIVTNSPSVTSQSESQDESLFKTGLGDAFYGYSDYFIQIKVFYEPRVGTLTDLANIKKIDWSVTEAKTGIKIVDETMADIKPVNKKTDMNRVTSNLTVEINKVLNGNRV